MGPGGLTNATQVLENLWLSGEEVTGDRASLQRERVTHIVNCSIRLANFYPRDFCYHRVSWADERGQVRTTISHTFELPVKSGQPAHELGNLVTTAILMHLLEKRGLLHSGKVTWGYLLPLPSKSRKVLAGLTLCIR